MQGFHRLQAKAAVVSIGDRDKQANQCERTQNLIIILLCETCRYRVAARRMGGTKETSHDMAFHS